MEALWIVVALTGYVVIMRWILPRRACSPEWLHGSRIDPATDVTFAGRQNRIPASNTSPGR